MKNFFLKSDLAKNSFTLIVSTILAQLIPLLLHPVLRRIYTPEDFGIFAVYLNIVGILVIMTSLRYEAAIVLPKNDIESANILSLTFILGLIFCGLVFLFLLFFKNFFCELINFPLAYSSYLYFLPFSVMIFSFYQGINFWLIRQKAFKSSAINKISRRGVEGVTQLSLGLTRLSFGLVLGDFLGNLANFFSGIIQLRKNNFRIKYLSITKIFYVFYRHKEFPLYNFFPTLLSAAATLLPFIFINKLFSSEAVGYLDLSRLVLSIPLALIAATVSQVIFQQVSFKKNHHQSIKKDLLPVVYFILAAAGFEMAVILLWGPELFGWVFGEKYYVSGFYSRILVYSFTLNFIISSFSSIFISLNKIKLISIWQICYFLVICSLLLLKKMELVEFLKIYVILEVIMGIVYCALLLKIVMEYENKLLQIELKN